MKKLNLLYRNSTEVESDDFLSFYKNNVAQFEKCGLSPVTGDQSAGEWSSKEGKDVLFALLGEKIVGMCGLSTDEKFYKNETSASLWYITDESMQGRGVARQMVVNMATYLRSNYPDISTMTIQVERENKGSRAVAEKLGFVLNADYDLTVDWMEKRIVLEGFSAETKKVANLQLFTKPKPLQL